MASILPGYEYDIFISYRQNDNRNGGVTEFLDLLKTELAATIKSRFLFISTETPTMACSKIMM